MGSDYVVCKICERGELTKRRIFRMSGPVVVIGFILLIPSVLGIMFSVLMLVGSLSSEGGNTLTTGIGVWITLLGIASFVGGLLGWLLVMKKRVLQCSVCGAVINAS
jgi:hypothetical protein